MNSSAVSPFIDRHISTVWERRGTDLLFTAGSPTLGRIDGAVTPLDGTALEPADTEAIAATLLAPDLLATLRRDMEVDFSFEWGELARFRGNAFHTRGNIAICLRLIPAEIPSFATLRLPPIAEHFARLPQGFVLVTGPTGSGKSTTLASIIDYINEHRACHIVTIEDPIEYVHNRKMAAISQREIGMDSHSFARALRSAFREDPDVVLVGEMRDPESIASALTIAETGHLVFATLHTNDAAQALDRIVDVFPADAQAQVRVQLASSLAGIISQRLLPKIGGWRVAAFEVLVANSAVKNLIKEGKSRQIRNVILTGQKEGMVTLEMSLSQLVRDGLITYEQAIAHTILPKEIDQPRPAPAPPADMPHANQAWAPPNGRR